MITSAQKAPASVYKSEKTDRGVRGRGTLCARVHAHPSHRGAALRLVRLQQRVAHEHLLEHANRLLAFLGRQMLVQLFEGIQQVALEQHVSVRATAQGAIRTEHLFVKAVMHIPTELGEQLASRFLDGLRL